ncbi:hypothetical protein [Pelagibius sp. Alg239-R121]|uniref:hypothetical protein n=1 Tax=Pelagibius sp. Alg239-R121 TaxID=2993448 RepID=UPI0024A60B04|nr:hypothetical protein [Pelagibius sp. Alg239-R121]
MSDKAEANAIKALQDIRDAIANNDIDLREDAEGRFKAVIGYVSPKSRRDEFRIMKYELDEAAADEVFQKFEELVEEHFQGLGDVFKLGAEMADDEAASLFFPVAATQFAQVAARLKKIKEAAEGLSEHVDELKDQFSADDVGDLISNANEIKEIGEAIFEILSGLKDGFESEA